MHIGFDVSPITTARTGVGNYCYYLLKHLLELAAPGTLSAYSCGRGAIDLGDLTHRLPHKHLSIPIRALLPLWRRMGRPRIDAWLGGADVVHGTNYYLPATASARRVLTVHDLAFLALPELASPRVVGPFANRLTKYVAEADAIMAYSEATKADVVRLLDGDPDKIAVAPMAVDDGFRPIPREEAQRQVREEFGIEGPFLLFVSTLEPRKNVPGLLRTFARLTSQIPHRLVLIGAIGWDTDPIFQTIEGLNLERRITRPGFVPHMKLPMFYCAADAFVFPTFYEGFGLPLLEALVCGCPVVAANNSAVPEVVGEGGVLLEAGDETGFAEAILRILGDNNFRDGLIEAGHVQAGKFSWRGCAETTLKVYQELSER